MAEKATIIARIPKDVCNDKGCYYYRTCIFSEGSQVNSTMYTVPYTILKETPEDKNIVIICNNRFLALAEN